MAVEHVDVHEVLQVLHQCGTIQTRQLVGTLDALGMPVRPEDPVLVKRQAKRVWQLATN